MIWSIYILSVFTKKGFAISWQHTEFLFCEQINQLLFLLKTIFYVSICILFYVSICILFYVSICILLNGFLCWVTCGTSWSCRMAGDVKRKYHAWRLAADRDTFCSCRGRLGAGSAPLPLLPHPLRMWQEVINQGGGGKTGG